MKTLESRLVSLEKDFQLLEESLWFFICVVLARKDTASLAAAATEPADSSVLTVDWLISKSKWLPFTVNTEPCVAFAWTELEANEEGPGVAMDDLGYTEEDPELAR